MFHDAGSLACACGHLQRHVSRVCKSIPLVLAWHTRNLPCLIHCYMGVVFEPLLAAVDAHSRLRQEYGPKASLVRQLHGSEP